MMTWTWNTLTLAAGVVGLILSAGFVARYLWEAGRDALNNPVGRFFITRKILLAVLFVTVILNRVDLAWWEGVQEPATALLIAAFAVQTVWPYRLLVEAQKEARMKEDLKR